MAGIEGRSGRIKLPGRLYRLNVRYRPDRHPAELQELLELVEQAGAARAADILAAVAAGGLAEARAAASAETVETETLLDDLFGRV